MQTLKERIKWCFENTTPKPTVIKAAKAIGVSRGAVYFWLDGTTKYLTAKVYAAAAKFFAVDRQWLETGEGEPRPKGATKPVTKLGSIMRDELAIDDPMALIKRCFKVLGIIDGRADKLMAEIKEAAKEAEAYRMHFFQNEKHDRVDR